MKSDPRIVDARRRARATARTTGQSYQHTLDQMARSAGRADWNAFLADPCHLTEDIPATAETDTRPVETIATPARRSVLMRWQGAVLAVVMLIVATSWTYAYEGPPQNAVNAGLAWERAMAVTSRMKSWGGDHDRAMYVMAKRLPRDRRDVRLVMLDNRPADNGFLTRLLLRTGLLDAGTTTYSDFMGDDGIWRVFQRHPVARLRHRVNCRTGVATSIGTEVADDMTSSPVAVLPSYRPFRRKLTSEDLQTLCAQETLDRTGRIERGL